MPLAETSNEKPHRAFVPALGLRFHHLTPEEKRETLSQAFRVLRPGGRLHIADFGTPGGVMRVLTLPALALGKRTADNLAGRIPLMISRAGFIQAEEADRIGTAFGAISLYQGRRPPGPVLAGNLA